MENKIIPTIAQIEEYLTEYGWHFRKTNNPQTQAEVIIAPCSLSQSQGILMSFAVNNEFVMVSTVGLLNDVTRDKALEFLQLNDTIKLVKLFATPGTSGDLVNIDLSFELWAESWNKTTFYCFMDMMAFSIPKVLEFTTQKQISHTTKYIEYAKKEDEPKT